jgi:hypothetical protein
MSKYDGPNSAPYAAASSAATRLVQDQRKSALSGAPDLGDTTESSGVEAEEGEAVSRTDQIIYIGHQ